MPDLEPPPPRSAWPDRWSTPPPATWPASGAADAVDAHQVVAYDLAHAAAAVEVARAALDLRRHGAPLEAAIACAFVADAVWDVATKLLGREAAVGGGSPAPSRPAVPFVSTCRDPDRLAALAGEEGPRHLDSDFELVRDTFRRFAEERIRPVAEHIHRTNADIPEDDHRRAGRDGRRSGCRSPRSTAGFASGGDSDYLGMVVATEELSRGSLGAGGSLITRPEILTRALVRGGTEEQKQHWLPQLASAEVMVAVAVTEPDFGSDVAGVKVTATPDAVGWVINGVKTWCTFAARADIFMLLARTDPDRVQGPPGPVAVHRAQAPGRRPRLRLRPGRPRGAGRRAHGGPADRHPRLPGHALLRDRLRRTGGCPTTT